MKIDEKNIVTVEKSDFQIKIYNMLKNKCAKLDKNLQ